MKDELFGMKKAVGVVQLTLCDYWLLRPLSVPIDDRVISLYICASSHSELEVVRE